jgi:3'(2'), 5'-bisphosphate nucleotidase
MSYLDIELKIAIKAALKAGKIIRKIYKKNNIQIENKSNDTPVTEADIKSNLLINKFIHEKFSEHSILSEELIDNPSRLNNKWCWIIDPLDGTKEFIKKNGEFCINIALSYDHEVVLGVILIPITNELYYAVKGRGSFYKKYFLKKKIKVSDKTDNITLFKSRSTKSSKLDELIKNNEEKIMYIIEKGSAIKGCLIAHGKGEVYYKFGNSYEWDTAAMQCIVEEAGGIFRQMDDSRMIYNRKNPLNRYGFYIINRVENKFDLY